MAKGLINRYVIKYVDEHRKEIKKQFKNDDAFVKGFNVTPEMLAKLDEDAKKEGIEYDAEEAKASAPLFSMILKALIGRDIYDNATYFKVYNLHDPIFIESLKLINSPEYDRLLSSGAKK